METRETVSFRIHPVPPFRLDLTVWALRRREENTADLWDGRTYRRVLNIKGRPVGIEVRQSEAAGRTRLDINAYDCPGESRKDVRRAVARILGTGIDLSGFYGLLNRHRELKPLVEPLRGLKPPRFPGLFEAVVNGIACQQLSLNVGILLLNRLAAFTSGKKGARAFPGPEDLKGVKTGKLKSLGFSTNKALAIIETAEIFSREGLDYESLETLADDQLRLRLLELRGVGPWTADYVLLRGFGRLNVFPARDSGARKNLERFLGKKLTDAELGKRLLKWQPYSGFIYFHLLLNNLLAEGLVRS